MGTSKHPNKKQTFLGLFFIDVSNEPKSVLTRELGVGKPPRRVAKTQKEGIGWDKQGKTRGLFV